MLFLFPSATRTWNVYFQRWTTCGLMRETAYDLSLSRLNCALKWTLAFHFLSFFDYVSKEKSLLKAARSEQKYSPNHHHHHHHHLWISSAPITVWTYRCITWKALHHTNRHCLMDPRRTPTNTPRTVIRKLMFVKIKLSDDEAMSQTSFYITVFHYCSGSLAFS